MRPLQAWMLASRHDSQGIAARLFRRQRNSQPALKPNRHRGESRLSTPATPPDMRVRIRRFGRIELFSCEQPWNSKRVEVGDRKRLAHGGAIGAVPWAVSISGSGGRLISAHAAIT